MILDSIKISILENRVTKKNRGEEEEKEEEGGGELFIPHFPVFVCMCVYTGNMFGTT